MTDFIAEAREAAKLIPSPPTPPANLIRFPTPSERMARESRKWMERYTVPMPPTTPPSAA